MARQPVADKLQLQSAGASTSGWQMHFKSFQSTKKILWGELAIFEFGGPRIKISCIKFVEDWHPDAQCMAYSFLFAPYKRSKCRQIKHNLGIQTPP